MSCCAQTMLRIVDVRRIPPWVTGNVDDRGTRLTDESGTGSVVAAGVGWPQRGQAAWTGLIMERARSGQGRQALKMYEEMRKDGVEPGPHTFVALLKACSSLKELSCAKEVHADVVRSGLETDLYVGTMLVNAYTRCGSLENARRVFEEMRHRDVVVWNALVLGYSQVGNGEESLSLYGRMQQEGVVCDERTFLGALKACGCIAEAEEDRGSDWKGVRRQWLENVRGIHADIVKANLESNVFVGNKLVDAYSKCGSLEDARGVFEKMAVRTVVSWTAMILGYAQKEQGEEALRLYRRMEREGVVPDDRAYVGVLKACSSLAESGNRDGNDGVDVRIHCLETVRGIHHDVCARELETDAFVGNMLVDAYAKCGSLEDARRVFDKMPRRDVVSWNTMILGYSQMEKGEEALQLYTRMREQGVVPNDRTHVGALRACTALAELWETDGGDKILLKSRCLKILKTIHADAGKSGLDVFVGTMLVDAYSKCGSLESGREVFETMPHRDVASWTAMMLGYVENDKGEEALQLYRRMRHEAVAPDDRAYVGALKACSSIAESGERYGDDDVATKKRCLEIVRGIHSDALNETSECNMFVRNMLVDAYAKCGSLEDARQVFDGMPTKNVVSWTAMIVGYAQTDQGEEALLIYRQMQEQGVLPNDRTYVGILNACGTVACLAKGRETHSQIQKAGLQSSPFMTNSLIDMYSKCSSMVDAQQVFDATPKREIVAWNALILGYARQGQQEAVFQLFSRMQEAGTQPNDITFLGVLTACSHVGLVGTGQKYFAAMIKQHGITPTIQHYSCMVDLLGRAGQIEQAMATVNSMPFQPDTKVWKSLLGACQKWGNVELGRQAFEGAVRQDMLDPAPYVLMANIYSAALMPDEARQVQDMRLKAGARKEPGRSWWTDEDGTSHVFSVADRRHPDTPQIYARLQALLTAIQNPASVVCTLPSSLDLNNTHPIVNSGAVTAPPHPASCTRTNNCATHHLVVQ